MKEHYEYDLGNGKSEHTVDEISTKLYLDKNFLEQILTFDDDEINSAIMKATKEKVLAEKMDFLKDNFSFTYLFERGPKKVLTNYFDLNKRKKSLLDSINMTIFMEDDGFLAFSRDTLDLISVNSVLNYGKTPYSLEQIQSLEGLKTISDGYFNKKDLDKCSELIGEELTDEELDLSSSTGYLALGINHARNLIDFVSEHSLPSIYNQMIFDSCVEEEKIGRRGVTYIKR